MENTSPGLGNAPHPGVDSFPPLQELRNAGDGDRADTPGVDPEQVGYCLTAPSSRQMDLAASSARMRDASGDSANLFC